MTTSPIVSKSGARVSTTNETAAPIPTTTGSVGPLLQTGQAPTPDRVIRVDKRGRVTHDAHTLPPRYAGMETQLNANIYGQSHAFAPILKCIQRYESGLGDPKRPVGAGFLGGPTGVGKTLTAEEIAICLHGEAKFIKIACGELQEKSAMTAFVGAPPTWTGHGKTKPKLTKEFIDAHRSAKSNIVVLLLDEFEKAHEDFQRLLLNVEENGVLTCWVPKEGDGSGSNNGAEETQVEMFNVLILKTTNAGAAKLAPAETREPIGFIHPQQSSAVAAQPTGDMLRDELKNYFSPEFLNRQDFFVQYHQLRARAHAADPRA